MFISDGCSLIGNRYWEEGDVSAGKERSGVYILRGGSKEGAETDL